MSETKTYKTADIGLAATLICHKVSLIGLEPLTDRKRQDICRFCFEDSDERKQITLDFTAGTVLVNPTALLTNVRNLKQLIKEKRLETEGADEPS